MESITFETTDKGKPFLADAPNWHFNLSHSGNWVLCGTAAVPIGVDVERIQVLIPDVLDHVLTTEERDIYSALPEENRPSYFYTLWTIKESYAKAIGFGLQLQFRDLTVNLETPGGIQIHRQGNPYQNVSIQLHPLDSEHPAAICVLQRESDGLPLQVTRWQPEDLLQLFR